jgi:UDP-GlcNAc:undecaprenyl-phosphate/decaprenyl-phosphate GlcNAc-1-phosphate transferase
LHLSAAIFAFSIACLAALALTPLVRRVAVRAGWRDRPGLPHKAHFAARPNVGGVALLLALAAALAASRFGFELVTARLDTLLLAVVPGALLVSAMGLVDDLRGCRPIEKLLAQIVALGLLHTGADLLGVNLLGGLPWPVGLVLAVGVALWMLALTNAMNLIDGIDGLATGVAVCSGLGLAALAMMMRDPAAGILSAALTGAALGFLRSNRAPARIYLGDSGSLLLGYLLAVIGAILLAHRPQPTMVLALLFIGWVPLLDTGLAVLRRLRSGVSPFQADRDHLHHRMVRLGVPAPRAAPLLNALQALAVAAALAIVAGGRVWIWAGAVLICSLPLLRVTLPLRVTRPVAEEAEPVEETAVTEAVAAADPRAA